MSLRQQIKQKKTARSIGLAAIASSLLILPVFGLLMPSNAAESAGSSGANAAAAAAQKLSFDLPLADPAILGGGTITTDQAAGPSAADGDNALVTVSDGSNDIPAGTVISRDNGRLTDASPDAAVSRPARSAIAMVGDYPIKKTLQFDGAFEHGDWVWNTDGAPTGGALLITVNLEDQVLSVFRGGHEIGTAVILYGADEKPTPTGKFSITEKDIDHVSNLYFAPMPYMLRLTNDGIAIHGSEVEYGYATHGCIGIPDPFAAELFKIAKLGDKVVITG